MSSGVHRKCHCYDSGMGTNLWSHRRGTDIVFLRVDPGDRKDWYTGTKDTRRVTERKSEGIYDPKEERILCTNKTKNTKGREFVSSLPYLKGGK